MHDRATRGVLTLDTRSRRVCVTMRMRLHACCHCSHHLLAASARQGHSQTHWTQCILPSHIPQSFHCALGHPTAAHATRSHLLNGSLSCANMRRRWSSVWPGTTSFTGALKPRSTLATGSTCAVRAAQVRQQDRTVCHCLLPHILLTPRSPSKEPGGTSTCLIPQRTLRVLPQLLQ
jgi:hypothetical protein